MEILILSTIRVKFHHIMGWCVPFGVGVASWKAWIPLLVFFFKKMNEEINIYKRISASRKKAFPQRLHFHVILKYFREEVHQYLSLVSSSEKQFPPFGVEIP